MTDIQLNEYETKLAPDSKARRDKLRDKIRKVVIARNLNNEKYLQSKYGADWKSYLNHRSVDKALAATRGKGLDTFVEEAKEIKKKKDKLLINPTTDQI